MSHDCFSVFKKIIQKERKQNIIKQEREDSFGLHYNERNRLPGES